MLARESLHFAMAPKFFTRRGVVTNDAFVLITLFQIDR
jgi:hypothetical protein